MLNEKPKLQQLTVKPFIIGGYEIRPCEYGAYCVLTKKEELKGILLFHFDSHRAVIKLIREKFGCQIKVEKYATDAILEWMAQPYREPILDDTEKKYLSEVIKPFLSKIKYIAKFKGACSEDTQYIHIAFYDGDGLTFPYFKANSMYKGMELNKAYTLKELKL